MSHGRHVVPARSDGSPESEPAILLPPFSPPDGAAGALTPATPATPAPRQQPAVRGAAEEPCGAACAARKRERVVEGQAASDAPYVPLLKALNVSLSVRLRGCCRGPGARHSPGAPHPRRGCHGPPLALIRRLINACVTKDWRQEAHGGHPSSTAFVVLCFAPLLTFTMSPCLFICPFRSQFFVVLSCFVFFSTLWTITMSPCLFTSVVFCLVYCFCPVFLLPAPLPFFFCIRSGRLRCLLASVFLSWFDFTVLVYSQHNGCWYIFRIAAPYIFLSFLPNPNKLEPPGARGG